MGFWGFYLIDEDTTYSEYVTEGRVLDGIDPKFEPTGRVVIPAFLEKCCGVDSVPGLSE
jgi:hypothetical protein